MLEMKEMPPRIIPRCSTTRAPVVIYNCRDYVLLVTHRLLLLPRYRDRYKRQSRFTCGRCSSDYSTLIRRYYFITLRCGLRSARDVTKRATLSGKRLHSYKLILIILFIYNANECRPISHHRIIFRVPSRVSRRARVIEIFIDARN